MKATRLFLFLSLSLEVACLGTVPYLASILRLIYESVNYRRKEPPDVRIPLAEYDFIIVGAGSAGCVLANRFSEVPHWSILLIEAGGPEEFIMDAPAAGSLLQLSNANWKFLSEPSDTAHAGMADKRCPIPRGKVMGGSSTINAMIYARGHPKDYDNWESLGNKGWGWKDVLPFFKKSQDMVYNKGPVDEGFHNQGGYLTVSGANYQTDLLQASLNAGKELGYNVTDYNGQYQQGFSPIQSTTKNGTRMGASRAFLHPIKNRRNLHVLKYARVTKVLMEGKKAVGVEYIKSNRRRTVNARYEVILSAGALNSPQILMLSGIGPKKHLSQFNITTLVNSPVGKNLMDHPMFTMVSFFVNASGMPTEEIFVNGKYLYQYMTRREGFFSLPCSLSTLAFVDTRGAPDEIAYPDIELQILLGTPFTLPVVHPVLNVNMSVYYPEIRKLVNKAGVTPVIGLLRPKSRGRVFLKSRDPMSKVGVDLGYYSDPSDIEGMMNGIKLAIRWGESNAMKRVGSRLVRFYIPGCRDVPFNSDDYWKCALKHFTYTNYHQCGTCKMGPNPKDSVVDNRLRVHGVDKLRVIDASIFPMIPSSNTNAPTIMVAEKASDMIKRDYGLQQMSW